jgi:Domain of unknown function (DUF222)
VSVGIGRVEHMYENEVGGFDKKPLVRVPFAALAARPDGRETAEHVVAMVRLLGEHQPPASGDRPADGREPERLADVPPGPTLATILDDTEPAEVDDYQLVEMIAGWERLKAHADARQIEAIAALTRRPVFSTCAERGEDPTTAARRAVADEISPALWVSPRQARNRVELACELVDDLPATLAELSAGRIDAYRARVIAEETRPLEAAARHDVETKVLAKAHRQTGPQLRAAARRAVLAADPAGAEQRHERSRLSRTVTRPCPEPDGMASALIRMPAEDLAALDTALDAAARGIRAADPDDPRTLDQLRADVLADLARAGLASGVLGCCNPECDNHHPLATAHGHAAAISITLPYTTAIGLDEMPAELGGYGPITPASARRIAADATWRRLLTDPTTGALLDHGKTIYVPPQDLADHVIARDRTCRFPTCAWPAASSDLDHTVPHPEGPTSSHNLGPLHRSHHNGKTRRLWRLCQPDPGRFIWTSATGHVYEVDPEEVGPIIDDDRHDIRRDRRPPDPSDPDPPPF